jgi:hypothetical protein
MLHRLAGAGLTKPFRRAVRRKRGWIGPLALFQRAAGRNLWDLIGASSGFVQPAKASLQLQSWGSTFIPTVNTTVCRDRFDGYCFSHQLGYRSGLSGVL